MKSFKTVDAFISSDEKWMSSLQLLRSLLLETELEEAVKWGRPVYMINGKNVIGLGGFKSYVGLWFFQGVFLSDPDQKLINAQEGTTKAMRQWRFNNEEEISQEIKEIRLYIQEAILNQQQNKTLQTEKTKPLIIPEELEAVLAQNTDLRMAFENFSPYKKREFADYISQAKRAETKLRRIEKITPMILNGIGWGDKWREKK